MLLTQALIQSLSNAAQSVFETMPFEGITVVDSLKITQWVTLASKEGTQVEGLGVCFAQDDETPDADSFKVSVHFEAQIDGEAVTVVAAHALDCRTGNELCCVSTSGSDYGQLPGDVSMLNH